MKYILLLAAVLTFASCQKEIETQEQFLARTGNFLRMQDNDKLAVTVDFYSNPQTVTAYINRYDSIAGQQVLVDRDTFRINGQPVEWTRNFRYTGFQYKGRLQVTVLADTVGVPPYEKWMTLTNANGQVVNLDTTSNPLSGWAGRSKIMDVVPKHYQ